jgi:tetratricopeptide (TPR) repeat protein
LKGVKKHFLHGRRTKKRLFTVCAVALAAMVFLGCAVSLEGAIARSAANIAAKLPAGTRVAIVSFDSPQENLSGYIMDEVTRALVDRRIEVADRNGLEYLNKAFYLQMSGDLSDESAQAIGRFLGAQYVIIGQLIDNGGSYRYLLNSINVETAKHESSTHLDVRGGQDFEQMLAALQKAVPAAPSYGTAAPKTAGTFIDRGIMFASRGDYDLAVADFTGAIDLNPDLWAAWMLRGSALFISVSRVIDTGEDFIFVNTTSDTAAAVSEERKAVYDRAIVDFTQAIRLDPNYAPAYANRGIVYYRKGDNDRAIASSKTTDNSVGSAGVPMVKAVPILDTSDTKYTSKTS